jgi:hypothetical protein
MFYVTHSYLCYFFPGATFSNRLMNSTVAKQRKAYGRLELARESHPRQKYIGVQLSLDIF